MDNEATAENKLRRQRKGSERKAIGRGQNKIRTQRKHMQGSFCGVQSEPILKQNRTSSTTLIHTHIPHTHTHARTRTHRPREQAACIHRVLGK